ncbi:hypothetical protein MNBD_GAMMA12-1786 [hydrothermal vent metagenome]|uniref:Tyr recombinase domain-containing protein n=1 Tax=hydrothermal vent metagenome TaxID=652676 RepID=A0A3B0YTN3_9ZZZZ
MISRFKITDKANGKVIRCLHLLKLIFKTHNHLSADGRKTISDTTQKNRWNIMQSIFVELAEMGYVISKPQNLKMKHIEAITQRWVKSYLAPKTFANYFSVLNVYCRWIKKPELMTQLDKSHIPADKLYCPMKATSDKDWSKTDDFLNIMVKVIAKDIIVGTQLLLMHEFGLRMSEALCLRPWVADCKMVLQVNWGTKNGRVRSIPIETKHQKHVLNFAKSLLPSSCKSYSLIPRDKTLKQAKNRFYYIVRKHGVSIKNGRVSHGLRHGYVHRKLEKESGQQAPIVSGKPCIQTPELKVARLKTSASVGHSRESIIGAYGG